MMPEAVIDNIIPGSLAAEAGIKPGDHLISINGEKINDVLDYQYACTEEKLELVIKNAQGQKQRLTMQKTLDADLGLVFNEAVFDGMMKCQNRCQFCFVDQMPRHLRRSLYIKDDDYRFSFLFGSFVTLGNLREQDWEKIKRLHLSPLYISVHATDPELRQDLVRPRCQPNIMDDLRRLAALGIDMHTQIVLCPGWNDGDILEKTITDLAGLLPQIRSIGVVPVGLTGHRNQLPHLKPVDSATAQDIISRGWAWQKHFRKQTPEGIGLVYLADEFFVKAKRPFPPEDYYDGYPQLENGIGICRQFWTGWEHLVDSLPDYLDTQQEYIIVCGVSALPALTPVIERLNRIDQLQVHLHPVENQFFGGQVTVTGLLTGQDIIASLKECTDSGIVLLPRIMFREGEDRLLDEITVNDIEAATGYQVQVVGNGAADLVQTMALLPEMRKRKVKARVIKRSR